MSFFDQIHQQIVDAMGPMGPLILLGVVGIALALAVLPKIISARPDPLDKLRQSTKLRDASAPKAASLRTKDYTDKLERFAHFLEPAKAEELSASKMKMVRAGYRAKNAIRAYHAAQFVLGIGMLIVGITYTLWSARTSGVEPDTTNMVLSTLIPGAVGYYLPAYWVQRRIQTRREEMITGFPDSLDMMLVCVEAGQSLDQSIIRVSKEIKLGYPALGEEYEIVAQEVKAGKERSQVLRDFGDRSGVPDIASFVTTMVQSASFGTSIADSLRVYAAEMRDKRVMRAEEKANVLPTKLTLGTMLFTVPPLLIILIGPSVYGIAKTLSENSVGF